MAGVSGRLVEGMTLQTSTTERVSDARMPRKTRLYLWPSPERSCAFCRWQPTHEFEVKGGIMSYAANAIIFAVSR